MALPATETLSLSPAWQKSAPCKAIFPTFSCSIRRRKLQKRSRPAFLSFCRLLRRCQQYCTAVLRTPGVLKKRTWSRLLTSAGPSYRRLQPQHSIVRSSIRFSSVSLRSYGYSTFYGPFEARTDQLYINFKSNHVNEPPVMNTNGNGPASRVQTVEEGCRRRDNK